jgi:ribosomal protein S5
MQPTYEYIIKFANTGQRISFGTFLVMLNGAGMVTSYGTRYQHPRGVARAVSAAYDYALHRYGQATADAVARAFVNCHGNYAYK